MTVNNSKTPRPASRVRFLKVSVLKLFPVRLLYHGKINTTIIIAVRMPITVTKADSPKNCHIIFFLYAPNTFLKPTSFLLMADFAVERFIKLMQAINRIIKAVKEKI